MARGKKRMWAGVTLVSLGVLAGAMVVASRWYAFQFVTDRGADREQWQLVGGAMQWVRAPTSHMVKFMGAASPGVFMVQLTRPGFDFLLESSSPGSALPGMTAFEWRGVCWYHADVQSSLALSMVIVWPIPLACGVAGVILLRSGLRRRRVARGHCSRCGYDLSATPAPAPCPECGAQRVESETGRSMRNTPRTS